MIYRPPNVLLVMAMIAFALCPQAQAQVKEGVAAVINDEVVSTYDVRMRMRMIISSAGIKPDKNTLARIQQQALRGLIDEHLQLQEAKKFEVDIPQAEVDRAMERLAQRNNASIDTIKNQMRQQNIDPKTLEDQIKAELAWQMIINGRYGSRVRVSNNQIAKTKKRMEANLTKPQYLVSEIFLESPSPEQDANIYQGALSLLSQMRDGAPFPAVAQQFSAAPSAAQGGDVGWVHKGDMPAEVESVYDRMKVGTVSSPIKVPGGFYIIALRDKKVGDAPMVADFRQIIVPKEKKKSLVSFLKKAKTCSDIAKVKNRISGAVLNPFNEVALNDLSPDIHNTLDRLKPGQFSEPTDTPQGVASLYLCTKTFAKSAGMPDDSQIADQLINARVAMLARRYLRDLRRDSTVEVRNK